MKLNEQIKLYREKSGMTKSELARAIDVSPSYITKLENGEKTNPSLEIQFKISKALNCSIFALTGNNNFFDQYLLQMILDDGYSINDISKITNIPLSELKSIKYGKNYSKETGRKLIQSITLFLDEEDDLSIQEPINTFSDSDNVNLLSIEDFIIFLKKEFPENILLTKDIIIDLYNKIHYLIEFEIYKIKNSQQK